MSTNSVEPDNLETRSLTASTASNSLLFSEKANIPTEISLQPESVPYAQLVINLARKSVEAVMVGQATSGYKKARAISLHEHIPSKDESSVPKLSSTFSHSYEAKCDSTNSSSSQESWGWESDESSKSNTDSSSKFECEDRGLQVPTLFSLENSPSFWGSENEESDMYALLEEPILLSSSSFEESSRDSSGCNRLLCPIHFCKSSKYHPHSRPYRLFMLRRMASRDDVPQNRDIGYAVLEA